MPLQRETEVHGFKCKFYDDGVVKVGTTAAARFTMRPMPDGDFDTQLLMELVKQKAKGRQLELPAAALATEFTTALRANTSHKKLIHSKNTARQSTPQLTPSATKQPQVQMAPYNKIPFKKIFKVKSLGTPLSDPTEERQWHKLVQRATYVRNRNPNEQSHVCRICRKHEESILNLFQCQ